LVLAEASGAARRRSDPKEKQPTEGAAAAIPTDFEVSERSHAGCP
jgi:hypothetical protein